VSRLAHVRSLLSPPDSSAPRPVATSNVHAMQSAELRHRVERAHRMLARRDRRQLVRLGPSETMNYVESDGIWHVVARTDEAGQ
jgi:hypothetical protein